MAKHKITIKFTTTKNGAKRALYWGLAKRWLPIAVDVAEQKIAAGEADLQAEVAA